MRALPLLLISLLALAACRDESLHAYGAADRTWRLVELRDAPFAARATLTFPAPGEMAGEGPCNSFTASQGAPYPWFEAGAISATRRACPDLAEEQAYFAALEAASLSEVLGDVLILSDDTGVLLTFRADG